MSVTAGRIQSVHAIHDSRHLQSTLAEYTTDTVSVERGRNLAQSATLSKYGAVPVESYKAMVPVMSAEVHSIMFGAKLQGIEIPAHMSATAAAKSEAGANANKGKDINVFSASQTLNS